MKKAVATLTVVCVSLIIIGLMLTSISDAKIDPTSIILEWSLDGDVKDSSGQVNNGEIKGNPKWVDGKIGKALQFDGVDDYVLVDIKGSVPQSITLQAWTYPSAKGIVFSELGQGTINSGWHDSQMDVLSTGEIKVGFWVGSEQGISLGTFSFNNWYHVTMTFDNSDNSIKGYVNGVLKKSGTLDKQYPGDLWYGIGAIDTTTLGAGAYFNGIIDEVAIFNVALKEEDIQAIVQGTAVSPGGKLTATWASIKEVR